MPLHPAREDLLMGNMVKLRWDDHLPTNLWSKWVHFFHSLFQLEQLSLDHCLQPSDSVSQPWLIIFSDGSDLAHGFAAYIRWPLNSGDYWCRLIMEKLVSYCPSE